jgi:signal transduction histidine kinase
MSKPLRALIIEDSQDDAELVLRELRTSGYDPTFLRVETEEATSAALRDGEWDVVLSDYTMPRFSAMEALETVRESGQDVPFIIVSGTIGEERAVEALKAGVDDYISKFNLARLVPVLERELREVEARRRHKLAEKERADLEAQLRQAQKLEAIGVLAGGIAHDFNNILTSIIGFASLAKENLAEGTPSKEHIEEVLAASRRATDLVRQILAFGRRDEQERRPITMAPVVTKALKLLRASLPATIELRQAIDPAAGDVLADPTQLHQVVMNLCTNAYQAMGSSGGVLEISLGPIEVTADFARQHQNLHEGPCVELKIRDSGAGIEPAAVEHIFEPFFTTNGVGEGTGLGLSVVHGIVTSHDGAIAVDSQSGQGTVFTVYLPRLVEGAADMEELAETAAGGAEHILLVDDEEPIIRLCREMLEKLGYGVTAYASASEALKHLQEDVAAFDIVFSDVTMPGMTGVQFAKTLRNSGMNIPVVLATGLGTMMSPDVCEGIGACELLRKPFAPGDLARIIRKTLDARG